jgi:hypothetical protein
MATVSCVPTPLWQGMLAVHIEARDVAMAVTITLDIL